MALLRSKPTSPGRRFVVTVKTPGLHKGRPVKSLTTAKKSTAGRNSKGRITVRHRGGGHKQLYRVVDFKRNDKDDIPATVKRIEYDPNRSAHIALICYKDGTYRYILAPKGIEAGATVIAGDKVDVQIGNTMPLKNIPLGSLIHAIEMKPGKGAQLIRSAGSSAQLAGKEGDYAIIRLRSGEMRKILMNCRATIGEVGHQEHSLRSLGKAGAKRWRGIRPTVRGVAMNPVDHPHGGGEGKTAGGRHPVTPWGVATKGKRTRDVKKASTKMIIRRRKTRNS
jgi:large subunit ribosomal protein L2